MWAGSFRAAGNEHPEVLRLCFLCYFLPRKSHTLSLIQHRKVFELPNLPFQFRRIGEFISEDGGDGLVSSELRCDASDKVYRDAEASERPGNEPSCRQPSFAFFSPFSCCIVFACLVIGFTAGQYATSSQLGKYEQTLKPPKACYQPALQKE